MDTPRLEDPLGKNLQVRASVGVVGGCRTGDVSVRLVWPTRHDAIRGEDRRASVAAPRPSAVLVAVLSGCSRRRGAPGRTPRPGTSPSAVGVVVPLPGGIDRRRVPSPTVDPATEQAVLAAYRGYWAERVKAQARAVQGCAGGVGRRTRWTRPRRTSRRRWRCSRQQGIEVRGEPVLSPTVTSVTDGDPATASITDCVDSTDWTPVFAATGESALPPGQPTRVVVESTASTYAGRWVIRTSTAFRDRTC